jgi:hypothetical protein
MGSATHTKLELAILNLLNLSRAEDLPSVVDSLNHLADEASIKAAILELQAEGLLDITVEWKLRAAAAAAGR